MPKKTEKNSVWKTMVPFIKPYRWGIIGTILMVLTTNIVLALMPSVEGNITSQLMQDASMIQKGIETHVHFEIILNYICLLLALYFVKTISQILLAIWLTDSIQGSMHDLRNALQRKIRRLPISYFDTQKYGDILSKITNDVDTVSTALQQSFTQILSGIFSICFALFMMFRIHAIMGLIAMMIIPLSLLITYIIVHFSQTQFRAQQDAIGVLNGSITEMYSGYNEIMLYGMQKECIEKFSDYNENLRKSAFRAQFISSSISPLTGLITYLTLGIVGTLGTIYVLNGVILVGQLQAFIRYVWQINDPVSQVSQLSSQLQSAYAAASRIIEVLNEEEEVKESDHHYDIATMKGNVTFDHVHFSYDDETKLIENLSLEVKSGEMVAIVGPTGAGKTTLINLLMRFYDVKGGSIRIDGIDIRDMKREELRSMFGMVLQDTWLFSGSILDNLRYGKLDACKEEVIEAAKMAKVHHFIRTLPDGYQMQINEEGSNISQGEKQLLTIARAILKNPKILILDEATSSVDTRLEKMLQEAMHVLMEGRTSFVIAHRLSTIKNADKIMVIQHGDIVEMGTHETLLAKNGPYASLYRSQFHNNED